MRCPGSTKGTTVPARGGSSAQIRESTFGLLAFRRPPRAFSSGSARPPRAPDASGTPRPGSGLSLAWPIRAPSARRATARRRDRRRGPSGLTPAWPGSRCVLASPDAPPAHAACGVMTLTPPRARPKRMHRGSHTRGALGAALALHARRAPVGRWELKAGGRAEGLWASVSASRV